MNRLLTNSLKSLNLIKNTSTLVVFAIILLRAGFLAIAMLSVWSFLRPGHPWEHFSVLLISFLMGLSFNPFSIFRRVTPSQLMMSLEIKYPHTKHPPFLLKQNDVSQSVLDEWLPLFKKEAIELLREEGTRICRVIATLPIPLLIFLLAILRVPGSVEKVWAQFDQILAQLNHGAYVIVLDGAIKDYGEDKEIALSDSSTFDLDLLSQNMISIKYVGSFSGSPTVNLKRIMPEGLKREEKPWQSLQMLPVRGKTGDENQGVYLISLAITEDSEIYISSLSSTIPALRVKVQQLPVPRVRLYTRANISEVWPDDRPLPLTIEVTSENPLAQVRLVIRADGKESKELVNNILVNDKKDLSSQYDLILENYVRSDIANVEITAEAVDRSIPIPLVGKSKPLVLRTASAYGRYQETLNTLRELKSILDSYSEKKVEKIDPKIAEVANKAAKQSEQSPFFDGLDRVFINRFQQMSNDLAEKTNELTVLEFSDSLNDFLFEHETLDDKERDRDFFVAARSLSRLIEMKPEDRAIEVKTVTDRILNYLDKRHERWKRRVSFLGKKLKGWDKVSKKPFHRSINKVESYSSQGTAEGQGKALTTLFQVVSEYREWIEELEAAEEGYRREQEKKRQQGLTQARNVLQELQKRQGKISSKLDRPSMQSDSKLSDEWPSIRVMQNSNIKQTASLEGQMRSLSPMAAERIKAAAQMMENTVNSGNKGVFPSAESSADMAGRLLRQAQSAARKSQRRQMRRGRRRRVTGDNYFGSQVAGGDIEIKRGYQVDKRYREEILDNVRSQSRDSEDNASRDLLESYLRQILR